MNNNAADPQAEAVAELKKWVASNKAALIGQGIASITGEYSGEGDSGQPTWFMRPAQTVNLPSTTSLTK